MERRWLADKICKCSRHQKNDVAFEMCRRAADVPAAGQAEIDWDTQKSRLKPLQNPIFGAFLRDALLERLKIFQYYLRVLRCYHFELHSNLGFCKGFSLHFQSTKSAGCF